LSREEVNVQITHHEERREVTVRRRRVVAENVITLELADPNEGDLPEWAPGAHIDLELAPGLVRQYSLCGDPQQRGVWRVGVLREPASRGGSAHIFDHVHEQSTVTVRGPRNNFVLESAPNYVFIAGGIGVTPILPMIAAAEAEGARWELHYGGRSRRSMAFLKALETYGAHTTIYPEDEVGLIGLATILGVPREDTLVYCCGPEPLLAAVEGHCQAWKAGTLHLERFAPKEHGEPVFDGAFEVELAESGLTLTVGIDQSILEVVEAAGVDVVSSCQEGTCGSCETKVLAGTVDHRDSLLTLAEQEANDTMFLCVSRAACAKLRLKL
jgi:ferredoxin-NADP reductase